MGKRDFIALARVIDESSGSRREAAIAELVASYTNDARDYGRGLCYFGDHQGAIEIFKALITQDPNADECRQYLAMCYSHVENVHQCRQHLRHLAEHASTDEMRRIGREQLEDYECRLGLNEEDRKLLLFQIQNLRHEVEDLGCKASTYASLGRILIQESVLAGDEELAREAVTVLERGAAVHPDDMSLLEMLAGCYFRLDPKGRLNETLKKLERLAPDSEVFQTIKSVDDATAREFSDGVRNRAAELMQTVAGGDSDIRKAALADLRRIVATYPQNPDYRAFYAFALMIAGEQEGALEQAERVAKNAPAVNSVHFNLGQLFWGCGDPKRGRHHFELALRYAESEHERRDVHEQIADLERR